MSDDEDLIENPYRAAIIFERGRAEPHAEDLRSALQQMIDAMNENAWVSSTADNFYSALTTHAHTLDTAGERAIQEFDDAVENMPERVAPNSSYAYWRNI